MVSQRKMRLRIVVGSKSVAVISIGLAAASSLRALFTEDKAPVDSVIPDRQ